MRKLLLLFALFSLFKISVGQLTGGIKLNEQRIGSAGNVLTVDEDGSNQLDVNDSLNTVVFIHRNDPTVAPGTNIGQYSYDVSKNGGTSWTSNIGPITTDPRIDNVSVNGRYPRGYYLTLPAIQYPIAPG